MLELNKIYCGDCIDVMQDIDNDRIDAIITDPPYGMSFMGKNWDKAVPSVKIWQECLRVLKPGAFAFVRCIPRQDCLARMICNLSDAGFNTSFSSIYHTFASGFPKAQNIGKQIDKRANVEREIIGKAKYADKGRVANDTSISLGTSSNSYITIPATEQAKALEGAYSGMQLKPAVEVVIVAMKPLSEKTYLDHALKNGHGCTWLDDCRIPYENESDKNYREKDVAYRIENDIPATKSNINNGVGAFVNSNHKGRFPANVLCEDDVLDDGVERKSGGRKGERNINWWNSLTNTNNPPSIVTSCTKDKGSFSRYFSLDAWFAERIKSLPKEAQKTFPFMGIPKVSRNEKNKGLEGESNIHPTCKSIKLMSWLITLASREGDIVLDPFCGSGTTLIAAKMLRRQYLGIDKEEEYCEIARKRIAAVPMQLNSYNML